MASFNSLRPMLRAANSSPASILTRSAQRSSPFSTTASNKFARLTLVGNLGAEPEHQATGSGRELVRYNVAVHHFRGAARETSWFRVTHFLPAEGPHRDFMLGLQKGTMVCVEGDAAMRPVEDSEGKRSHILSLVQRNIEVLRRPYNPDFAQRGESEQSEQ